MSAPRVTPRVGRPDLRGHRHRWSCGRRERPVRRGLSKEKKQQMAIAVSAAVEEDDGGDWVMEVVPKQPAELERIKKAVKANFLFQHLNDTQAKQVYDVMKRVAVKKNDVVIRQGDQGDWFYVVDEGEYVVTLEQGGKDVEILRYTTTGGANPCFGELALMYSKPRAATVTAVQDGVLWAMDRRSFRSILMKSSAVSLTRTLRSVEVLKSLSVGQLQRLQDLLTEQTFKKDEYVIKQVRKEQAQPSSHTGDSQAATQATANQPQRQPSSTSHLSPSLTTLPFLQGDTSENLYIISEGRVRITQRPSNDPKAAEKDIMELGSGQYFGERALLTSEPRAANVIAIEKPLKVLYISKEAFEEVLGPLQEIIDADRQYREDLALKKQLQQESEGLANVKADDFGLEGRAVTVEPFQYILAKLKNREYTIKKTCLQVARRRDVATIACDAGEGARVRAPHPQPVRAVGVDDATGRWLPIHGLQDPRRH